MPRHPRGAAEGPALLSNGAMAEGSQDRHGWLRPGSVDRRTGEGGEEGGGNAVQGGGGGGAGGGAASGGKAGGTRGGGVEAGGLVEGLRSVKGSQELALMRKAAILAGHVMEKAIRLLK